MSNAPTVWIYNEVHPKAVAGSAYMVAIWRKQLTDMGFKVRVFAPSGNRNNWRTEEEVAFTTWINAGYVGDEHARFSTIAQLRRAEKDGLPDLILVATPGRVGMLGMATAQRFGVPLALVYSADLVSAMDYHKSRRPLFFVAAKVFGMAYASKDMRRRMFNLVSLVRDNPGPLPKKLPVHLLRAAQNGAQAVIMLSLKRTDEARSWAPHVPLYVIPSGIDRLPDAEPPAELSWRDDALKVLYVGRLAKEKRVPVLLDAVKIATDQGTSVHLTMVGEGELPEQLIEQAKSLGITDRFTLIGPYQRDKLRPIYASADVFAFASTFDTQGFVLNEVAHEGVPMLVCDPDVNPVVKADDSALAVGPEAKDFAEGFRILAADPALRARLGARAKERANDLTERRQSEKVAAILRGLIDGAPPEPATLNDLQPRTS